MSRRFVGVARWQGASQPLGAVVARAIRDVLAGEDPGGVTISKRAADRLAPGGRSALGYPGGDDPAHRSQRTDPVVDLCRLESQPGPRVAASSLRTTVAAIDNLSVAVDPGTSLDALRAVIAGASEDRLDTAPACPEGGWRRS